MSERDMFLEELARLDGRADFLDGKCGVCSTAGTFTLCLGPSLSYFLSLRPTLSLRRVLQGTTNVWTLHIRRPLYEPVPSDPGEQRRLLTLPRSSHNLGVDKRFL